MAQRGVEILGGRGFCGAKRGSSIGGSGDEGRKNGAKRLELVGMKSGPMV